MRATTAILYGVTGQTVEYRVPQGRPTSATFDVFNEFADDASTALFSGTATVDSVTQSVSSSSGAAQADPQRINVTSTGIVTSRKYLLSEGLRQEWVSPIEVGSGYIRVRHPLKNDYTSAGTLVGTTITATIDTTFAATVNYLSDTTDPNPSYRVRWQVVLSGGNQVAYSYFDLVRSVVAPQVDIDDINARAPGLVDTIPTEYREEQGRPLVEAAVRSVQADLAALGLDTDAFRDDQILDELVILRALNVLATGGWRPLGFQSVSEYAALTRSEYDRFLEKNFQAVMTRRVGVNSQGSSATKVARPFFSK